MIYCIELNIIPDIKELLNKLHNFGYKDFSLNDYSFCPYLIVYKNDNNELEYININEGFYQKLLSDNNLVKLKNINDFIEKAYSLNKLTNNSLF